MRDSLRPGTSLTKRIMIDRDRTIGFMGEEARVYATPRLVSDVELTCRELLMEHCDEGEDSVGAEIALKHLAPTLAGSAVEITARVAAGEGRKVMFEVVARDEIEEISSGTHTRFVLNVAKRIERLKAKAARLKDSR
jgi:fluoroacetyl-CoA thioesterase